MNRLSMYHIFIMMIITVTPYINASQKTSPSYLRPTIRSLQQLQWALERRAILKEQFRILSRAKSTSPKSIADKVLDVDESLRTSQQQAMLETIRQINTSRCLPNPSESEPAVSTYFSQQEKRLCKSAASSTSDTLRESQEEAVLRAIAEINAQCKEKQSLFLPMDEPTISGSYLGRKNKKESCNSNSALRIEIDSENFPAKSPTRVTFSPDTPEILNR
jgi:hypothetical protein